MDLDGGALLIARSVVRGEGGLVEKDTKTHQARRIALDDSTVELLTAQLDRCEQRARACGRALTDDAFVFSYEADGSAPWAPLTVSQRFGRLRDRLGLEGVRLHDLRVRGDAFDRGRRFDPDGLRSARSRKRGDDPRCVLALRRGNRSGRR